MMLNLERADGGALLASLFLLMACGGGSPREGVTPTQAHMFAHYDRAGAVQHSLVNGDLAEAREAADWIATHAEIHRMPPETSQYDEAVRTFARRVSDTRDIQAAAMAAARMGSSCGDCHENQRVTPRFLMGTAVPSGEGPRAEMARHVWAADRMWVGLLGPSDAAWMEGAHGFQGGWLDTQEVLVDPENREQVRDMVRQIYELAGLAEKAQGAQERAEIYGQFLVTCADCHRLTLAKTLDP